MNLKLREYQETIIQNTHRSMLSGHRRIVVVAPCGSGKTCIFAWMASQTQKKGKSVWFIVHRQELMDQTIDTFTRFGISMDNIFVGMVSTAANHPERLPDPDLIILDECHHSAAATWQKIIQRFPDTYMIGLTATPCRLDGKPLGAIFTDMVIGVTTTDLIGTGYLSKFRYFAPSVADLSGLKRKGSDFDQEQASELLMTKAIYGDVLQHWRQYANNLQTIIYCSSIKHSQAVAEAFREAGIDAVHFDGNTPKQERRQIVSDFRNGIIKILCNVDLIGEGFDVPDCQCCVLLRPTASLGLFIQQTGRALRPLPGKTAIILDHVGNYARHGLPDDQREWSLEERIKQPPEYGDDGRLIVRQCPNCYYTFPTGPDVCPNCGTPIINTREELKNIQNIRLEEIKNSRRERAIEKIKKTMDISDCRTLQDFQAFAKLKGYKPGYAFVMWQNKLKKGGGLHGT
ncbi:MAG: DEAD/DEAH box helicase family protein [Oscillospiraceae bacterium]|nr:DEAD/DEAH box helicase family protein [Oscillospiraceae bacterium]